MPTDAPRVKEAATIAYGAEVTRVGLTSEDRRVVAERIAAERGFLMVRPFDDPDVVAGQGTGRPRDPPRSPADRGHPRPVRRRWSHRRRGPRRDRDPALHRRLQRRGGGGAEDGALARRGRSVASPPGPSIADGLRPNAPGEIPFAIARERLAGALTVGEAGLEEAVELLLSRARLVVEPSGAAGVAALWSGKLRPARGPVVVVLSGAISIPQFSLEW